jgi:ABC-type glycerol-3-phosphate transport system substrate-binding protein
MTSVELHLWVMPVRGASPRRVLERLLAPFHRAHPRISIRIDGVPWGTVWDRLMSALKGRHGAAAPDVLQLDGLWTGTLAALGLLQELTPRLWEMEREGALPPLWESCYLPPTRRLFAVPWTLDLKVLRFRRDALASVGLTEASLATWEGVEVFMKNASRRRTTRTVSGGESLLAELVPWVWAAGGSFFSADERRPAFVSPESLKAFSLYRLLSTEGPAAGLEHVSLGAPRDAGSGIAPLPRGPAGRFSHLGGSALAVAGGTRHSEESWLLLRHLASAEVQREFSRQMGLLPPRPADADHALPAADRDVLREALASARILPPMALLGSFERLLQRHLAPAAREAAPWDAWRAALERAARETEVLLSHYEPPSV